MTLLMVSVGVLEALDTNELRELDDRDEADEARRKLVRIPVGEKRERMVWNRDGDCILADGYLFGLAVETATEKLMLTRAMRWPRGY